MQDIYFINIKIVESNNASSKAVNDCNSILKEMGINPFTINIKKEGNKYIKKINNYLQINKIKKVPQGSTLIIQHPIYLNKRYIDIIKQAKETKNLHLIFIIHDLESLRRMFPDVLEDFEYVDKQMFEIADHIIAHNEEMKNYIISKGVAADKIYTLKIFDYLTDTDITNKEIKYSKTINIAGNLGVNKCKYIRGLNDIDKSININLYGLNFDKDTLDSQSINYKGAFPASEIPEQLNEGFGLVWDGESINGCTGHTGEYLKYNNPHKLSLYLVSGLPVVIWSKAAEAQFVIDNNVGIAVDTIEDFSAEFDSLSQEKYYEMVENAKKISYKLRHGKYLENVITEIINK